MSYVYGWDGALNVYDALRDTTSYTKYIIMIQITARISSDFTYDHCEMVLYNTCYTLSRRSGVNTASVTLPNSTKMGCKEIEDDLLNLGLLCDGLLMETVV